MTPMKKVLVGLCLYLCLISCKYKDISENSKVLKKDKDILQNTKKLESSKDISQNKKDLKNNKGIKTLKSSEALEISKKIKKSQTSKQKIVISPERKKELICIIDVIYESKMIQIKKDVDTLTKFKTILKSTNVDRCPKNYRDAFYELNDSFDELIYLKKGKNVKLYRNLVILEALLKTLIDKDLTTTLRKVIREERNDYQRLLTAIRDYNAIEARYLDIINETEDSDLKNKVRLYKVRILIEIGDYLG